MAVILGYGISDVTRQLLPRQENDGYRVEGGDAEIADDRANPSRSGEPAVPEP